MWCLMCQETRRRRRDSVMPARMYLSNMLIIVVRSINPRKMFIASQSSICYVRSIGKLPSYSL
jgi:hypothetical protein